MISTSWYECIWGFAPDCEGVAFAEDGVQPEGWISYTCRACQEWGVKEETEEYNVTPNDL